MNETMATIYCADPGSTASAFRLLLAAERGYSSHVAAVNGVVVVTASDGRSVCFVATPVRS